MGRDPRRPCSTTGSGLLETLSGEVTLFSMAMHRPRGGGGGGGVGDVPVSMMLPADWTLRVSWCTNVAASVIWLLPASGRAGRRCSCLGYRTIYMYLIGWRLLSSAPSWNIGVTQFVTA